MTLTQLEYFCTVCRYHSIAKAAAALYVVPDIAFLSELRTMRSEIVFLAKVNKLQQMFRYEDSLFPYNSEFSGDFW